jgi:hypothetical protein
MEEWEVRWKELEEEADAVRAECGEDMPSYLKPQSMSASLQAELKAELVETAIDSERWLNDLWNAASKIHKRVSSFAMNAASADPQQMQPLSRSIERELSTFKARQRAEFDALASTEFGLEEVLPVLGRRFESWLAEPSALLKEIPTGGSSGSLRAASGSPRGSSPRQASSRSPRARSRERGLERSDPVDTESSELRTALETLEAEEKRAGGIAGGWNMQDHEVFMRISRVFKNQVTPAFFAKVEERLPNLSKVQIADHARWLAEHEQRQATKRRLLARWRERKLELEREASNAKDERAALEAEQQRQASKNEMRQRAETKRRLAEWKKGRADEEEFEADRQKREELEQARLERDQRNKQLHQKELVDAFRRRREAQQQALRREEEQAASAASATRRALSQDDKQRIARRNAEVLRRKLQAPAAPAAAARAPSPARAGRPPSRGGYEHVESRLYDTTECFIQKIKAEPPIIDQDDDFLANRDRNWRDHLRRTASAGPHMGCHGRSRSESRSPLVTA